jgi:Arylsulfotransferase (ASST)
VRKHSRALALNVDETAHTATVISARTHPRGLLAATQGNQQALPNGDALVGWGSQRYFTEFAPDGRVLWNARLSVGYETYRAYRMPWVGRPFTTPRAAVVRLRGGGMNVYASWNGATEVASWQVLGGASPSALQPIDSALHAGFETRIPVSSTARYVAVRALDAGGGVLGTSPARRVG